MSVPRPHGSPRASPRASPAHSSAVSDARFSTQQSPNPSYRNSEYRNGSGSPRRGTRPHNDNQQYVPQGQTGNRQSTYSGAQSRRPNVPSETSSGRHTSSSGDTGHRGSSPSTQNRSSARPRPGTYTGGNGYGPPNSSRNLAYRSRDPEAGAYQRQNLNRQRSLTRPERQRQRTPMIRTGEGYTVEEGPQHRRPGMGPNTRRQMQAQRTQAPQQQQQQQPEPPKKSMVKPKPQLSWWAIMAIILTCCCPSFCLKWCCKKGDPLVQQAWREKVALCYIILSCCAALAFLTFGLRDALCPEQQRSLFEYSQVNYGNGERVHPYRDNITVYGQVYKFEFMQEYFATQGLNLSVDYKNTDMSGLFDNDVANDCNKYDTTYMETHGECIVYAPYGGWLETDTRQCLNISSLRTAFKQTGAVSTALSFDWSDIAPNNMNQGKPELLVYGETVLNISYYLNQADSLFFGRNTHIALMSGRGQDGSAVLTRYTDSAAAMNCILARYTAGVVASETMGCVASEIIMMVTLVVIVGLIVVRFTMAVLFQWFISSSLVKPGGRSGILAWRSEAGGNYDPANERPASIYSGAIPTGSSSSLGNVSTASGTPSPPAPSPVIPNSSSETVSVVNTPIGADIVKTKLYTAMLVTCYSEGEASLRTTLDSLAATTYSTKHKVRIISVHCSSRCEVVVLLFFIIADGIITGSGNDRSTPDICISMLTLDPTMADPAPATYMAIADGEKQLNRAKVVRTLRPCLPIVSQRQLFHVRDMQLTDFLSHQQYAGHYKYMDVSIPAVLVVKSGNPAEVASGQKAGNRGKRDSQLILMSFFQRVLFNDRLTELDYELFWKMSWLMKGVTPDKFELVLMVDADTKVLPDSLTYMVAAMVNDITIMGLCGETRIANKRTSWVTGIQVFEYYISHHYAKAFESVFGGVTCLPGCFCMYRIKAPKNGAWVPILANPDIVLEYNQNVVTTLHAKNLLLLGEDRFLSTLMLRTFPKRQMMFVPQARCKTVVPDSFSVLLSQRRRWINSTVHNLMELVLVSDLCGIACLSMQFAVFLELIGTIVLPAAVCFTLWLVIDTAITANPQIEPLVILAAILGLPALLIVMTTRKLVYIMWMFGELQCPEMLYLAALPVWNFVLPVYSFWHFDDFSWGQTRQVAGEVKGHDHSRAEGEFDSSQIVMKKWEEWERERLGQKKTKAHRTTNLKTPSDFNKSDSDITLAAPITAAFGDRKMFGSPTNSFRNSIATPSSILLHPDNAYRASSYMPQGAQDPRRLSGISVNGSTKGTQMAAYQRQSAASAIPLQDLPNRSSTSIGSASDASSVFTGHENEVANMPTVRPVQRNSQLPLLNRQDSQNQSYEMQSPQAGNATRRNQQDNDAGGPHLEGSDKELMEEEQAEDDVPVRRRGDVHEGEVERETR
ncbi:chitin synthase-domain-containing protein [Jimgerdemannia flammicorona]|uniref:chitin synthase n=1 Tax=Jimgerdemannia flammicorona TaxID=994334 RepID=A0A433DBZ7_9FUNG|nr:chitin synthase-domain-containing protein [Jimgerdemannia flammicorona]